MRDPWPRDDAPLPPVPPAAPDSARQGLIGEYERAGAPSLSVLERDGSLAVFSDDLGEHGLRESGADIFAADAAAIGQLAFARASNGRAQTARIGGRTYHYRPLPDDPHSQVTIASSRPLDDLLQAARQAAPPLEEGDFLDTDHVDLREIAPSLRLDLRYASTNNFLGHRFYDRAVPRMQRPFATAIARAQAALTARGYGLVILDAYRPWYVTRAFWDAMPTESRWLVANPAGGSRHNRGAAIDLTLCHLASGEVVQMPSTFDEPSVRAYAYYPGSTARQRWHRDLLRQAMEREGFAVNRHEWWHFDHPDWVRYRIENSAL